MRRWGRSFKKQCQRLLEPEGLQERPWAGEASRFLQFCASFLFLFLLFTLGCVLHSSFISVLCGGFPFCGHHLLHLPSSPTRRVSGFVVVGWQGVRTNEDTHSLSLQIVSKSVSAGWLAVPRTDDEPAHADTASVGTGEGGFGAGVGGPCRGLLRAGWGGS